MTLIFYERQPTHRNASLTKVKFTKISDSGLLKRPGLHPQVRLVRIYSFTESSIRGPFLFHWARDIKCSRRPLPTISEVITIYRNCASLKYRRLIAWLRMSLRGDEGKEGGGRTTTTTGGRGSLRRRKNYRRMWKTDRFIVIVYADLWGVSDRPRIASRGLPWDSDCGNLLILSAQITPPSSGTAASDLSPSRTETKRTRFLLVKIRL